MLDQLDLRVASVHSKLAMDAPDMTRRMVAAVRNPRVNVLGHCTGRMVMGARGTRKQSQFDAKAVFTACVESDTAVEINSRPERRDPPTKLLELARDLGCLFSIDSDAHAPGQLDFLWYGAERAEAAGIDPDRIVNTWPKSAPAGVGQPLDSIGMAVASEPAPEVEVRRSKRRRRTVSAYRDGEKIVVLVPASLTRKEEAEWVETMVARVQRSERTTPMTDAELMERALVLNDRYLGGLAVPGSVRWVQNQKQRWGSCTPGDRTIRLSVRLQGMPAWVIDYVLVHELSHLHRAGPRRGVLGLGGPLPAGRAREGLPARAGRPPRRSTRRPATRPTSPGAARATGRPVRCPVVSPAAAARRPATSGRRSTPR